MVNTYDNYYDAIDAEGVGATVNIGGKIVKAETADGYQGKGSSGNNNGIIGDMKAVGNSIKNAALDFAGSTGLKPATYSVGADGKGISKGGLNDATIMDFPALLLNSVINAEEAAKLNPYWDNATKTYDKSRDVNGDGVPDYDINGNMINPNEFNSGVYKKDESTGQYVKYKGDGTVDDGENTAPGTSDFDKVVATATEKAIELANNKVQTASDALTETSQGDTAIQAAEGIVGGTEKLPSSTSVAEATKNITVDEDAAGTKIEGDASKYATSKITADVDTTGEATTIDQVQQGTISSYNVDTVADDVTKDIYQVDPVTGVVTDKDLVDADSLVIDTTGLATGVNKDGSVNLVGKALEDYATQNTANIVDTTTTAGKLLALELGEGNYTDSKSTILGQIDIISKMFVDANGNPRIPPSHSKVASAVQQIIGFSGASGTAAQELMINALTDTTLTIAKDEASGFAAIDAANLSNRQQAIINKSQVLANVEIANLNTRTKAAVQNSQNFMSMNLANLSNEQKAEEINKQNRVLALFEDSKAVNTQRMFDAQAKNDFEKFYDQLNVQVQQYNATAKDNWTKWEKGEINDNAEFNATLENNREQFYQTMQYNIDLANAKWRQAVTLKNTELQFEAASADAKNMFNLSTEALNQIWDRADAIFDYAWKTSENALNRDNSIAIANIQASAAGKSSTGGFWGALARLGGTFLGTEAGASWLAGLSDVRLKENIKKIKQNKFGINFYRWDWNDKAKDLGISVPSGYGVLAQELQKTHPEMVSEHDSGYLIVDYGKLQ